MAQLRPTIISRAPPEVGLYGLHRSGITSNSHVSRQQCDPLHQGLGDKDAIERVFVY